MEEAVRERMISGDVRLHLVEGSTVVGVADLADGRYPGDDGHIRIAAAVGKVISPLVGDLRARARSPLGSRGRSSDAARNAPTPLYRLPAAGWHRRAPPAAGCRSPAGGTPQRRARAAGPGAGARARTCGAGARADVRPGPRINPGAAAVSSDAATATAPGAGPFNPDARSNCGPRALGRPGRSGAPRRSASCRARRSPDTGRQGQSQFANDQQSGYALSSSDRYAALQPVGYRLKRPPRRACRVDRAGAAAEAPTPQPTGYPYGVPPIPRERIPAPPTQDQSNDCDAPRASRDQPPPTPSSGPSAPPARAVAQGCPAPSASSTFS